MEKKKVVVVGAGRSATHLIEYLANLAEEQIIDLVVADINLSHWAHLVGVDCVEINIHDAQKVRQILSGAFCVVSMVPADFHILIVRPAVEMGIHAFTPSYVSSSIHELNDLALANDVLILNEMGVDPGIDHMSAMELIHRVKSQGMRIESFESYTGGLVARRSDTNKWGYKISWNPRNIVLAGSSGHALFRENGKDRLLPYGKLFSEVVEVKAADNESYEGYANRNSLTYVEDYGLEDALTVKRGTLRKQGFSRGWNFLVQSGYTNDATLVPSTILTWNDLSISLLGEESVHSLKSDNELYIQLDELGLFSEKQLKKESQSCAAHLQNLLEEKWRLEQGDSDKIVMVHRLRAIRDAEVFEYTSSLVIEGENERHTAMSKTVGMPIAFAVERMIRGEIKERGVRLPILPELYLPILADLKKIGVEFIESESICS
ncbi:MAG: saccharopine dehydrogenase C-terminal domain-containing protein [Bacteroidota bacterium]